MNVQAAYHLVAMGVAQPHGIRGEIKVVLYNESSEFRWPGATLLFRVREQNSQGSLGREAAEDISHKVLRARASTGVVLITLEGVPDRNAAEKLAGREIFVPRSALPELDNDEVYVGDLVGLEVHAAGQKIGSVTDVRHYPTASCLVVPTLDGVFEVPVSEPYVVEVAITDRIVHVAHLEDLEPVKE